MHAQQSFLNVCNTAILGYHGDRIILYRNVKYVKNHRLSQYLPWKTNFLSGESNVYMPYLEATHWVGYRKVLHLDRLWP